MIDEYIQPINEPILIPPDEPPIIVSQKRATYNNLSLRYHKEVELQFIKKGQGAYFIQDQNYAFKKNSLIIILPYEVHRLIAHPGLYIEKWLALFPETMLDEDSKLTDLPRHICLAEDAAADLGFVFANIDNERKHRHPFWQDIIKTDLKKLIFLLRRNGAQTNDNPLEPENQLIKEIVKYIEMNFVEDLTLNSLSDRFALSPTYLSYLFKKCTGLNLRHYVIQRRIMEAQKLLENDSMLKISSIPQIVGFHDFTVFNRNFRQITGLTPSAYRKIIHKHSK
ncbi:MAG: AraC family transcriptional regulator [bacterium]|nr:AraC family transcriptional regulator [bacterium]